MCIIFQLNIRVWFICERCTGYQPFNDSVLPLKTAKNTWRVCDILLYAWLTPYELCLHAHAAAFISPEINWIPYPWETSAISGSVGMYAGEDYPRPVQSDITGVYYGGYYRMRAWNPGKQPLAIDTPVNIERHARRWINQFASLNLRGLLHLKTRIMKINDRISWLSRHLKNPFFETATNNSRESSSRIAFWTLNISLLKFMIIINVRVIIGIWYNSVEK